MGNSTSAAVNHPTTTVAVPSNSEPTQTITSNNSILFVLGAGASVSSGLRTYRGPTGIYPKNVEQILCPEMLNGDPGRVWEEIRNTILKNQNQMTIGPTYHSLKKFADRFPKSMFVTQNVDGLIRQVGIPDDRICELHGELRTMKCMNTRCKTVQPINWESQACTQCGTWCRPSVVLFGENINPDHFKWIKHEIRRTRPRYVIVVGTTLMFPYLKHFVQDVKSCGGGEVLVLNINPDSTSTLPIVNTINYEMDSDEGLESIFNTLSSKIKD